MQLEKWAKIEEVFNAAAVMPDEKARHEFIIRQTENEPELRTEIFKLLENDGREFSLLDAPVFTLGTNLLAKSEEQEFSLPKEFAHYQLQKILGRGGMGTVFLAQDTRLNRKVALKILPQSLTSHRDTVARFRQEAYAASNVTHNSFAHIYDFGEWNNRYYLTMEYVRGATLREAIKEKLIDEKLGLDYALQIASALSAAHSQGIIHRDIKPENIIVTTDGSLKILDFGLAKFTNQTAEFSPVESLETIPGMIIGTPAFMSPEQIRGHHLDQRTDIWSLGVVLYEMLAGRRPFHGDSPSDIQAAVLRDKPEPLSSDIRGYREIFALIEKCLAKDRLKRFQSASDFIIAARAVQTDLEEDKTSGGTWRLSDWMLRAVLPLLLVVGGTLGISQAVNYFSRAPAVNQTTPPTFVTNERINSLIVPPFQNLTDDASLNFLSEGLAEDLTRSLGSLNHAHVIAYSSARKIHDPENLELIKNTYSVDAVLRGRLESNNSSGSDRLAISVEIVSLNDGKVLWQEKLNASAGDFLKLRNTLTIMIVDRFQSLTGGEKQIAATDYGTHNNEAFLKYLEGKYAPDRTTATGTEQAIKPLKRAIELDPKYALAHVALAEVYNLLGTWFGIKPDFYQPLAKKTIETALQIDPNLSETHMTLAKIRMDYDRDFAATESEFKKAIELNPNNAIAHYWYGEVYLAAMGRFRESLSELETARSLFPTSAGIVSAIARTRQAMKDYEVAIIESDRAIKMNPDETSSYSIKAISLLRLGRIEEAIDTCQIANQINDSCWSELAAIYVAQGQPDKAREILKKMKKQKGYGLYNFAVIYAALGERDHSFELLDKLAKSTSVDLLSIRIDPLLDVVRDDPRFAEIEKQINLPPLTEEPNTSAEK